ncbi:MAG: DUF5670 family protein [Bacteroidales bacterium]
MKNLVYSVSGLLIVNWGILFWGLDASGPIHLLLVLAGIIALYRYFFSKQSTNKKQISREQI